MLLFHILFQFNSCCQSNTVGKKISTLFAGIVEKNCALGLEQHFGYSFCQCGAPGRQPITHIYVLHIIVTSLDFAFISGERENELGTNTPLIRALKYTAIGTITIHLMSCAWYSMACANIGAVKMSCDASSWAVKFDTGRSFVLIIIKRKQWENNKQIMIKWFENILVS